VTTNEETTTEDRDYLPATSRHMPLAFYDAFTRLLGVRDAHWRLVAQAGIEPGATVLEIGTGTGPCPCSPSAPSPMPR
jgi:protein-L-isoaspartate O-methyltransferase